MIRIGVNIMAHPKRAEFVKELLEQLDAPATVTWDCHNNRWETGRRAMLARDMRLTHWLVLQDDAIVCQDLVAGLHKALEYIPKQSPVCLYAGLTLRNYIERVVTRDTTWLTMSQIHWGVGILMPTPYIDEMISFGDRLVGVANYDKRISRWVNSKGLTVYYPWPSLVDHRTSPSLVPGRGFTGRRAIKFLGSQVSALGMNWTGKQVHVSHTPRRSRILSPLPEPETFTCYSHPNLAIKGWGIQFQNGIFSAEYQQEVVYLRSRKAKSLGIKPLEEK